MQVDKLNVTTWKGEIKLNTELHFLFICFPSTFQFTEIEAFGVKMSNWW